MRGPLLERYFGPELMQAFRETKRIFDPAGVLNPGMITDVGPIESMTQNLRVTPAGHDIAWPQVDTYFDYSNQGNLPEAIEVCSGAGVCRRTAVGVMCPSYRATLDERHSTRGRANALRLAISGQFSGNGQAGQPAWDDPDTIATLDLCLSCKACKSECPSNVDVARLKAEYTAQRYRENGRAPLAAKVFGHIRTLNRLGSLTPNLANWVTSLRPVRAIMNALFGLAPQRSMPKFAPSLYRWFAKHDRPADAESRPRVVLFADCFVTYNEPAIGQAAVAVLEALGYAVELPKVGCCGRAMISNGLLEDAIKTADATLQQLRPYAEDDRVKAIVVCEPSCLATMKDEWLGLKLKTDIALRRAVAAKAIMVDEFIERDWKSHPANGTTDEHGCTRMREDAGRPVVLHGHCHQKAIWGENTAAAAIRRFAGESLTVLPSGCCGMAGAFGYAKDHYDILMKIGDQSLFSLLSRYPSDAVVLAPGTSCRHQIRDGTGREAKHPIELIALALSKLVKSGDPAHTAP